jgi:hypothetical protein
MMYDPISEVSQAGYRLTHCDLGTIGRMGKRAGEVWPQEPLRLRNHLNPQAEGRLGQNLITGEYLRIGSNPRPGGRNVLLRLGVTTAPVAIATQHTFGIIQPVLSPPLPLMPQAQPTIHRVTVRDLQMA